MDYLTPQKDLIKRFLFKKHGEQLQTADLCAGSF
jgi:hypothetical protein